MNYDYINGEKSENYEEVNFYTIGELISVCGFHASHKVIFANTQATVGHLGSWRGAYHLPAIEPSYGETKTGKMVAKQLQQELKDTHYGYKGGEYHYNVNDEFYIAAYGCSSEYKVVGYQVADDELILLTKIDPY